MKGRLHSILDASKPPIKPEFLLLKKSGAWLLGGNQQFPPHESTQGFFSSCPWDSSCQLIPYITDLLAAIDTLPSMKFHVLV